MDGMDNTDRTYVAAYSDDIWQEQGWEQSESTSSNLGDTKPSTENNANDNNVHE